MSSPSSGPGSPTSFGLTYIPSSFPDGQTRFGMIEDALAEGDIKQLHDAEEKCKNLVLDSVECSEERKWLVRQLVELRLRIQEKQDETICGDVVRLVQGHHMQLQQNSSNAKLTCDRCCGTIWDMIHSSYLCRDCDYMCHARCLSQIIRTCVHLYISENPQFELRICPEIGLATNQHAFKCAECKVDMKVIYNKGGPINCFGLTTSTEQSWIESRLCDYSGWYFCSKCHWNSTAVIPARVVHNWDFEPRKVSRAALQLIKKMSDKPILDIKEINSKLFRLVDDLNSVQALRDDLLIMKKYLIECKTALEHHLLWQLKDRQHFIESSYTYTLQDLIDINSGLLLPFLTHIHAQFLKHIKEDCKRCYGRGYICELCDTDEVIFPFDSIAIICELCKYVFHRSCWSKRNPPQCTRCIRLSDRAARMSIIVNVNDDQDDKET